MLILDLRGFRWNSHCVEIDLMRKQFPIRERNKLRMSELD